MKTALWIVIGLIVIALVASLAFGMDGNEAAQENEAPQTVATSTTDTDLAQVRADAAADLTTLRARAEAGEAYETIAGEYAAIRARVAAAYQNAGAEAAGEWQGIEAGFNEFEASARAGGSGVLDSFASLIARFSADVRTETPTE
jgi:hypothetical protein